MGKKIAELGLSNSATSIVSVRSLILPQNHTAYLPAKPGQLHVHAGLPTIVLFKKGLIIRVGQIPNDVAMDSAYRLKFFSYYLQGQHAVISNQSRI